MTRAVLVLGADDSLAVRIAAECADRQVTLLAGSAANIRAAHAALALAGVRCANSFRELAASMAPLAPPDFSLEQAPMPKYGTDRPYLKKKKGRS